MKLFHPMDHATNAPHSPAELADKLRHLPVEAQAAFGRFQRSRAREDLDPVIFAILEDFLPPISERPLAAPPGSASPMADLGLDSLAITELVFFAEDLFGITISNDDLLGVRTLDELRSLIHRKATASAA